MKPAPPVIKALLLNGREGYRGRRANPACEARHKTGRLRSDPSLRPGGEATPPESTERSVEGVVRAIHRAGTAGRCSRTGRGEGPQAQLHRHRAHPARPPSRGGRPCGTRPRVARHHGRGGSRPGCAHRRPGRRGHDRPDSVHAARQEGARAGAARGSLTRPQLHRDGAHPSRPRARERRRRRADPSRLRCRCGKDPQRDHPDALRPGPQAVGRERRRPARRRRARSSSTSSAEISRRQPSRASSTPSSGARPRSSA